MSRKIDSYMDRALGCDEPRAEAMALPMFSYRVRPTACASVSAMPPELLMRPRIPRAPKLPAFSLYPLSNTSRRPPAPALFAASAPAPAPSWSALGRDLEAASPERDDERSSDRGGEAPAPSRLDRAYAYVGVGAAAGLVVASFMLFCK